MPVNDPCSVQRKCSSTGVACNPDDRTCQTDAIGRGLEVTCERVEPRAYVYCPPGAEQRDSSIVWILLLVAVGVAVVGGVLSFLAFRKRLSS